MDLELPKDFKEFLRLLRAHGVEYLCRFKDLADLEQLSTEQSCQIEFQPS